MSSVQSGVTCLKSFALLTDRNPDNFFAETEQVAFCVSNIVPGIDFTNDPLMQGRLFSYLDTQMLRLGGPNFHEMWVNKGKRQSRTIKTRWKNTKYHTKLREPITTTFHLQTNQPTSVSLQKEQPTWWNAPANHQRRESSLRHQYHQRRSAQTSYPSSGWLRHFHRAHLRGKNSCSQRLLFRSLFTGNAFLVLYTYFDEIFDDWWIIDE